MHSTQDLERLLARRHLRRLSTSTYNQFNKQVLRPPVESSQYTSVSYTDRIDELGVSASIGTVGDSFDNALAESVMGIFKTELHRNPAVLADNGGHWRGLDDLEVATCAWVSWFNEERLHGELDDRAPVEVEAEYSLSDQAKVA